MNDDDLVTDSLRALRESTDGASDRAARTRTNILAQAEERRRRSRRTTLVLLPLAAALLASGAWAAVTGRLAHRVDVAGEGRDASTTIPAARPAAPSATAPETELPAVTTATPSEEEAPAPATSVVASRDDARVAPAPPASNARVVSTEEQALYSRAHRAHFVERDPSAALAAWDAYLAGHPDGRFALEARYNRAISLVRLGRRREAREALTPFAEGTYGGYRRTEARALLDAFAAADAGDVPR
jgi:TolA-binding protein